MKTREHIPLLQVISIWLSFLFADSISKLFIWISAEIRSCALQYVFLSTNSDFLLHYALEVVEKVVLTVYMCTNDINFIFFNGIRGLF